jgi:hypothetical protein
MLPKASEILEHPSVVTSIPLVKIVGGMVEKFKPAFAPKYQLLVSF